MITNEQEHLQDLNEFILNRNKRKNVIFKIKWVERISYSIWTIFFHSFIHYYPNVPMTGDVNAVSIFDQGFDIFYDSSIYLNIIFTPFVLKKIIWKQIKNMWDMPPM